LTITHLGAKRLQGTKFDRKNDSLGSSADGSNSGITLIDNYVRCKVYNSSGVEQTEFTSAKLRSDIGTSAFENVTMTGSHTVAQGDRIVMQTDGGDSSNKILFLRNNSNGNDNPSNTSYVRYESGSFSTQSKSMTGSMIFNGSTVNLSSSTDEADSYPTSNEKFGLQIDASASQIGQTLTSVTFKLKRVGNNPAKLGIGAYSFDGSNDTVNLGTDLDTILTGDFSFTTWAYMPNATSSGNKTIICKPATTSWANPYHSFTIQHTGGNIDFQTNNGSTNVNIDLACGQGWHHIAVTKSGTTFTLYIDGNTSESQTISGTAWGTQDWIIGNTPYNSRYFDGDVDDMSFWSRALTATEIGKLANNNVDGFSIATFNNTSLASYDSANNEIDFEAKVNSSQQNGAFAIDMLGQTVSDTKWTMRMKVNFSNIGGGNGSNISFNIAKNGHTTSNATAENIFGWAWGEPPTDGGTGSGQNYIGFRQGTDSSGASSSNYPNTTSGSGSTSWTNKWYTNGWGDSAENTDYYIELARTSATEATFKVWTGSYGGTQKLSGSVNDIPSGTDDLRYFKFCNRSNDGANRPGNTSGALKELSFWNGTNDTTETADYTQVVGDAQSVSTISNKAGLKAHYTMDSTSLNLTPTYNQLFENASDSSLTGDNNTGGSSYFNVDSTVADALYVDPRRSSSIFGQTWDLGTTLSETAWVLRAKYNITSLDNTGDTVRLFFGINNQNSTVGASNGSNKFIGVANAINSGFAQWYRLSVKGNTLDVGEASQRSLTTETLYIEIIRKSGTKYSVRLTNNSDFTGGTFIDDQDVGANGGSGSTSSMNLRYVWWSNINVNGNQNAHQQGNFEYVEVYNGVTSVDGCKNDASSTSDLEAMTNLPTNTIFEQTDDTPSYWFKQSDNTWLAEFNYALAAWATADTSAMYVGGTTSAWTANNATQTWNGTSWASSTNLTNARELLDGGGNATDYISVGGDSGGAGSPQDDVYKWNGSSWSSGGTISSNTFMLSAGGNTSGALWCGGNNGSGALSTAQTYNGSSWTAISSMSDPRRGHLGDGIETDFIAAGGYDDGSSTQRTAIEIWNGTSWSAGTAYNGSNGDLYGYGGGAGRTSSFLVQTNQKSQSNTYTYDGSVWSLTGNSTGGSVNYSGLGGTNTNAIKAGGSSSSSWAVNTSELFNGNSWTATNNLATGISTGGMGGNS